MATDTTQQNTLQNNSNIPVSSITPTSPLNIVTPPPDNTNYGGITSGISDQIANEYNSRNTEYQGMISGQQTNATQQNDLISQLLGKTADTQKAQEATGVNTAREDLNKYVTQLTDLNAQASALNREAQAIPLLTQERNKNVGATDGGVAPQDTGALRQNAIKALSIGQQADTASAALTGSQIRLQQAQDKAQQIIDLKYKPIEDALAVKKQQYELNKDMLDIVDKRRSEALNAALKKEEQQIADKKAQEKQIQDIALEAAKNGASPSVLRSITSASSYENAISLASGFMQNPLDVQYKRAQIAKMYQDIQESKDKSPAAVAKVNKLEQQSAALDNISLVDDILKDPSLKHATGAKSIGAYLGLPTAVAKVKNQLKQVKGILALENRSKLKGSGAISDFEAKTLERASSSFGTNLSDADAVAQLKKIRGVFQTSAGLPATIKITDPLSGKSQIIQSTRDGINQAIADGLDVEYQ